MRTKTAVLHTLKVLHEVGSVGLMGGVAVILLLRARAAPGTPLFVELCHAIDAIHTRLIFPSMLVVVLSGFASMMVHRAYWNALWAWAKGGSGVVVLQFTFRMRALASSFTDPETASSAADLADGLHKEALGLWILLGVSVFNVIVGVVRPRFRKLLGRTAGAAAP